MKHRLPTIFLFLWHVEIINKHNGLLANRWAKHTLSSSVQLGHDYVLSLVGGCSRREVDIIGNVSKE